MTSRPTTTFHVVYICFDCPKLQNVLNLLNIPIVETICLLIYRKHSNTCYLIERYMLYDNTIKEDRPIREAIET